MDAQPQTEGRYYRPELDVVRFLALAFVFLHHALPTDSSVRIDSSLGGFTAAFYAVVDTCRLGLSLFFTLSAFLICELLLREKEATGTVVGKQFYIRRILRIWPLYYLALIIGAIATLLPSGTPSLAPNLGWFAIFMGAWFYAHHGDVPNTVFQLWSISVEEQFYAFAPWTVKFFNRRALYLFCFAILAVSNAMLFYYGHIHTGDDEVWFSSLVQFQCFAAGILLCLVLRGRVPALALWHRGLLLAASWGCWFYAIYGLHARIGSPQDNPGGWALMGGYALTSLGCVMILLAFLGIQPRLLPAWAIYLGRISYGLYVFHLLALHIVFDFFPHTRSFHVLVGFVKVCLAFGLMTLFAAVSYRFFETPFLKLKRRHAVIQSQPISGWPETGRTATAIVVPAPSEKSA